MTFATKGLPPGGEAGPSFELHSLTANSSNLTPPNPGPQVPFCDTAEFDAEIAIALTVTGWRAAAAMLVHASTNVESGDFLSAERDRRSAREQLSLATTAFRQFIEARAAAADWIRAGAVR